MQKLNIAFAVLLLAVLARADSIHLNQGSGFFNGVGGVNGFSFNFYGNGNTLQNVIGDEFLLFAPDIYLCDACLIPNSHFSLGMFAPPSTALVNGTFQILAGGASIDTLSINIVQNRNHAFITGLAQARGAFMVCSDINCTTLGQGFVLGSRPWHYRIRMLNLGNGYYQFQNARMQTVPEPGTLWTVGTGIGLLIGVSLKGSAIRLSYMYSQAN